jgi:WXG100 family type VII secretion target
MAYIQATPDQLRAEALTYSRSAEEIQTLISTIESMNAEIFASWSGNTPQAFEARWNETLKPNLVTVSEALQEFYNGILNRADAIEQLDMEGAQGV